MNISAILLAAGSSSRFGGDKLLHPLPDGTPIGVATARNLKAALKETLVVVRPGDERLVRLFSAEGMRVTVCDRAHLGMGASLAWGVSQCADADGWIVALAAPAYRGQRGHPVGFAQEFYQALMGLTGDAGARDIVAAHAQDLVLIDCDDPGILRDIDRREDLKRGS